MMQLDGLVTVYLSDDLEKMMIHRSYGFVSNM